MYRSFEHKFNVGDTVYLKQNKSTIYTIIEVHGIYDSAGTYGDVSIQYLVRRNYDLVIAGLNEVELEVVVNSNNEVTNEADVTNNF